MRKQTDNLEAIREFKWLKMKKNINKVQMVKMTEHNNQILKQTSIQVNLRVSTTKKRKSKQSRRNMMYKKISRRKKLNFDNHNKKSFDN